jgi:hypothetical protein
VSIFIFLSCLEIIPAIKIKNEKLLKAKQDILDLVSAGAIQIREVSGRKTVEKRKHRIYHNSCKKR